MRVGTNCLLGAFAALASFGRVAGDCVSVVHPVWFPCRGPGGCERAELYWWIRREANVSGGSVHQAEEHHEVSCV